MKWKAMANPSLRFVVLKLRTGAALQKGRRTQVKSDSVFRGSCSTFKTRTRRIADRDTNLLIIETNFRERAIAPAMTVMRQLITGHGEDFVRLLGDIHFLGAKMLAAIVGFHGGLIS